MPFSFNDIAFGFAIPAVIVMAILLMARRAASMRRFAILLAIAIAFVAGYFPLKLGPLTPQSHWHWIPSSLIAACLVAALLAGNEASRSLRAVVYTLVALATGWLLVPTWPDLAPSRSVYLATWPVLTAGIAFFVDEAALRTPERSTALMLFVTCSASSVLIVLSDNLRFAQMALILAGIFIGILLYSETSLRIPNVKALKENKRRSPIAASIGLPVAVSLCGLLLVARVNSFSAVPLVAYFLPPAALVTALLWNPRSGNDDLQNEDAQPTWKATVLGLWPTLTICGMAILIAMISVARDN